MEITTLCVVVATLTVLPNRSQFFLYESVSLSCGQQGNSSDWTVKRNISPEITEDCPRPTDRRNESHCFIDHVYIFDTGVYWCESAAGKCSNTVNITVTGSVILESPVLPEMEGDDVTLRCRNRTTSSSSLTMDFYKDQLFIGSSSTGNITIHSVSKSDEGLYRCHISGAGGSPGSWLTVRGHPEPPQSPITLVLLPVGGFALFLVSVSVMLPCLCRSHKGEINHTVVLYSDVTWIRTCNQKGEPLRRNSFLFSSVAVYRPDRCIYTPNPELMNKACS
ncbi:low affinity immunoglobulin gamma Fc region receptor II-c-like isoform X2 [Trachinotus anak]|uniref:low affinity immunoglobulin gamma Fc region receptor II-c-like isoform X2 n=1 Tax=Trachinotus anak TaxID=443729 RepID=UPI0039F19AC1